LPGNPSRLLHYECKIANRLRLLQNYQDNPLKKFPAAIYAGSRFPTFRGWAYFVCMISPLSPEQIARANELVREMERIEVELQSLFGQGGNVGPSEGKSRVSEPKKRTMSPAARARIASAQRARWAKARSAAGKPAAGKKAAVKISGNKRRVMSPEARAKIAAAQKKRWAKFRRSK
jgi:hypothetical protein